MNTHHQALHLAAQWNHPDVCRLLIDHGAMVDARTKVNWTPLHVACREGNPFYYYPSSPGLYTIQYSNILLYILSTHPINLPYQPTL